MTASSIVTRQDFITFLDTLRSDLTNNPAHWENQDLQSFLEAMRAWTNDMDGYYQNMGMRIPADVNWQVFADILNGARIYE